MYVYMLSWALPLFSYTHMHVELLCRSVAATVFCPLYYTSSSYLALKHAENLCDLHVDAFTALIWIVCQAQSIEPQPVSGMQVAEVITLLNHAAKEHGILHLAYSFRKQRAGMNYTDHSNI